MSHQQTVGGDGARLGGKADALAKSRGMEQIRAVETGWRGPQFQRLVFGALWLQGVLVFAGLQFPVAGTIGLTRELFKGIGLKVPLDVKASFMLEPLLGHPYFAAVCVACWTFALYKLYHWRPDGSDAPQSSTQARLEIALAMHLGLNVIIVAFGLMLVLPFANLLGCL